MDSSFFYQSVGAFFGFIFVLDYLLKKHMGLPYINFLRNTGLVIKPLTIGFETIDPNRPVMRHCIIRSAFLGRWFEVGSIVVSLLVIPALCMLYVPVLQVLFDNDKSTILKPIVQSLKLPPFPELSFYLLAAFLCVAFHEFGRALAAGRENVSIEAFGVAIFGIFPTVYIRMSKEHLRRLNASQLLRIFTAGIWHNLFLAAAFFAIVSINQNDPQLNIVGKGHGVSAIDVKQNSSLSQNGLMENDIILGVNECPVKTKSDWSTCIQQEYAKLQSGFCVVAGSFYKKEIIIKKDGISHCCPENSDNTCFRLSKPNLDMLVCLPATEFTNTAKMCIDNQDCLEDLCLVPVLHSDFHRLLRITLGFKDDIIYIGTMEEILSSVAVSPYVSMLGKYYGAADYSDSDVRFFLYIVYLSCALAMLNTIPLFVFDGSFIVECIINGLLQSTVSRFVYPSKFTIGLKISGSVGILLCVIIAFAKFGINNIN